MKCFNFGIFILRMLDLDCLIQLLTITGGRPREEAEGVFLSIAPLITIILNQFNSKTHA